MWSLESSICKWLVEREGRLWQEPEAGVSGTGNARFCRQEGNSIFGSLTQSPQRSSICITPTRSSLLIASLRRAVCPPPCAARGLELNLQVSWSCQVERNSSHQLQHWVTVVNYLCGRWEQIQTAFSLETDTGCWGSVVPPLLKVVPLDGSTLQELRW